MGTMYNSSSKLEEIRWDGFIGRGSERGPAIGS